MDQLIGFISDLLLGDGLIIAVAVFIFGEIIKTFENKKLNQFIPLTGSLIGIALGLTLPTVFINQDIISKAIMGMALGWAATGAYETIVNLTKTNKSNRI